MDSEYAIADDTGQVEMVKERGEVGPDCGGTVFPDGFVVEPVGL